MKELRINPNRPRDSHEETAWLERDQAALHHLDLDRDPDAPADDQAAPAALPPQPAVSEPEIRPEIAAAAEDVHSHAPDTPAAAETGVPAGLPPLLATLLTTLPRPGAPWSAAQRLDWLRAAEDIFHLVYKTEGRLRIDRGE